MFKNEELLRRGDTTMGKVRRTRAPQARRQESMHTLLDNFMRATPGRAVAVALAFAAFLIAAAVGSGQGVDLGFTSAPAALMAVLFFGMRAGLGVAAAAVVCNIAVLGFTGNLETLMTPISSMGMGTHSSSRRSSGCSVSS